MLLPGGNIFNLAIGYIAPQPVMWRKWLSHTRSSNGSFVNTYDTPVPIVASLQGVDKKLYQQLGLDMSKNYALLYSNAPLQTVRRDASGDLIIYAGRIYKVETDNDWFNQDGWSGYTCIQVDTV